MTPETPDARSPGGRPDGCPGGRDDLREDLVALLDGALEPPRQAEVEAHLAACASCEAERAALALAWQRLDALPGLSLRPGLLAEVEAAVLASEPATAPTLKLLSGGAAPSLARGAGLRRWLAAAAAALLVAGAGLVTMTGRPGPTPGDQALRPDRPAPQTTDAPTVVVPTTEVPTTETAPVREPSTTQTPTVEPHVRPPSIEPGVDPLAALPAEERDLVMNLELLRDLEELEGLGLLDAAELFDDLEAEEFDEG